MINITVDDAGQIAHVGIGYDVLTPSGQAIHRSGYTWHNAAMNRKQPPATVKSLQNVIDKVIAEAQGFEGV